MKQKLFTKYLSLLLVAAMLLTVAGCIFRLPVRNAEVVSELPAVTAAPTPDPTPAPAVAPMSAPLPDQVFAEIDEDFFRYLLHDDPSYMLQVVKDPAAMGFDISNMKNPMGSVSKESYDSWIAKCRDVLQALENLDRGSLSPANQFAYDTLKQELNLSLEGEEFYGYDELLGSYSGLQSNILYTFLLYEIDSEEDTESYFWLLRDVPRLLNEVLAYEQLRSELGIFMPQKALTEVLSQLDAIINAAPEKNALLLTFEERIHALALSDEKKNALIAENFEVVTGSFTQAYIKLRNGLKALEKTCRRAVSIKELKDEKFFRHFELTVKLNSGKNLSVAEGIQLLDDAMEIMQKECNAASAALPAGKMSAKYSAGTFEENLAYLRELTEGFLPVLPEHVVKKYEVHEQLQDQFSPAAYLLPGIDDWSQNMVIVNQAEKSNSLLLTMAHETYPGHLYQYNYQRALPHLSRYQQIFPAAFYAEGWSQFSEYQVAKRSDLYRKGELLLYQLDDAYNISYIARLCLDMHSKGYTRDQIGLINEPDYFMKYAFGIANMFVLYDKIKEERGDAFDEDAFLKEFLDLGPSFFNLIEERMLKDK